MLFCGWSCKAGERRDDDDRSAGGVPPACSHDSPSGWRLNALCVVASRSQPGSVFDKKTGNGESIRDHLTDMIAKLLLSKEEDALAKLESLSLEVKKAKVGAAKPTKVRDAPDRLACSAAQGIRARIVLALCYDPFKADARQHARICRPCMYCLILIAFRTTSLAGKSSSLRGCWFGAHAAKHA